MALPALPVNLSRQVSYFHFAPFASGFALSLSLSLSPSLSLHLLVFEFHCCLSSALRLLRICFGERSSGFHRFDTANTRKSGRSSRIFPVSRHGRPCMHLDRREESAFFPHSGEGGAAVRGRNVNASRRGRVARIISVNSCDSRVSTFSASPKSSLLNF